MIFISLALLSEYKSLTAGTDYSFQCKVGFFFFFFTIQLGNTFGKHLFKTKQDKKKALSKPRNNTPKEIFWPEKVM